MARPPSTSAHLLLGFLAGALSVLLFHQGMLAVLHATGISPRGPYSLQPTAPLGVAQVVSLAFWGGVWGMLLVTTDRRLPRGGSSILIAALFGAIAPTLVAWLVVAPLKGQPLAAGGAARPIVTALLVNTAWGAGTAILLLALRHPRTRTARRTLG
jgi:hypothetical protein